MMTYDEIINTPDLEVDANNIGAYLEGTATDMQVEAIDALISQDSMFADMMELVQELPDPGPDDMLGMPTVDELADIDLPDAMELAAEYDAIDLDEMDWQEPSLAEILDADPDLDFVDDPADVLYPTENLADIDRYIDNDGADIDDADDFNDISDMISDL